MSPYELTVRALAVVDAAIGVAGSRRTCRGSAFVAGHYARPGQVRELRLDVEYRFDFDTRRLVALEERSGPAGRSTTRTLAGPMLLYRSRDGAVDSGPFTLVDVEVAGTAADAVPEAMLAEARAHAASLRWLGERVDRGRVVEEVAFSGLAGRTRTVAFERASRLPRRVTTLEPDPVRGDEVVDVDYAYTTSERGPTLRRIERARGGRMEMMLDCADGARTNDDVAIPDGYRTPMANPPLAATAAVESIAKGLHAVTFSHIDSRALVYELEDHALVFEAPRDSATGALLLDAARRVTGGKPIRYLLLTHHHPDHAGGLRPFVAAGIPIVTTPGNVEYLTALARAPHALEPDAQWREPRAPRFEVVRGRRDLGDADGGVVAYDVGPKTHHTDENLVFYLPALQIVFEGDLLDATVGGARRGGSRASAFFAALRELDVPIASIVQSWPVRGQMAMVPMAMLEEWARSSGVPASPQ